MILCLLFFIAGMAISFTCTLLLYFIKKAPKRKFSFDKRRNKEYPTLEIEDIKKGVDYEILPSKNSEKAANEYK